MEIKSTVSAEQLLEGIWFRGETNGDAKVVERISELSDIVFEVVTQLSLLKDGLESRREASAKDIQKEIEKLEKNLKEILGNVE
ncbi:hypothetical protein [Macrococcus armenti]|uniref:hypothetical protein n=1 Tax=Macrococcus armenti TaxID=2875764 RepID=UPI001CCF10F6|nr:hypothetical protein [Macrococcus armenti]UBH07863.1 hypothetical protein LAU41_07455 [Macrococcus armenti]